MAIGVCIGSISQAALARAETVSGIRDGASWEISASPYAYHFHHDDAHRHVYAIGVEVIQADHSLWGASAFRNSFGQASGYVYYGHEWNGVLQHPALYAKLSAGLMYGYRGEYRNKVPLNRGGFSPGVVPALGYRVTPHDALQVDILGTAGLLFSYARKF